MAPAAPKALTLPLFDTPARSPRSVSGEWPTGRDTRGDPQRDALAGAAGSRRGKRRQVDYEDEFAFQCRTLKLPEPVEQFYFAKELDRRFKADFAWPKYRLLVEIQGGIWRPGGGAHSHPIDIERDVERQQYCAVLRYTMLPFLPKQVMSGYAIELTQRVLEKLGWAP